VPEQITGPDNHDVFPPAGCDEQARFGDRDREPRERVVDRPRAFLWSEDEFVGPEPIGLPQQRMAGRLERTRGDRGSSSEDLGAHHAHRVLVDVGEAVDQVLLTEGRAVADAARCRWSGVGGLVAVDLASHRRAGNGDIQGVLAMAVVQRRVAGNEQYVVHADLRGREPVSMPRLVTHLHEPQTGLAHTRTVARSVVHPFVVDHAYCLRGMTDRAKTYVLDTSVLLSDPTALHRFDEHDVVVPLVVLSELEAKRQHPELGWAARESLRTLEALRERHGSLLERLPINDLGGTLRVEVNHTDRETLPSEFRIDSNDHRILSVAHHLQRGDLGCPGVDVVLVSKDLPLRLKAGVMGLAAVEYRDSEVSDDHWTGMAEIQATCEVIDELFAEKVVECDAARQLPCNTGVVLINGSQSALARVKSDKRLHLIRPDHELFAMHARSSEQHLAIDLLADPDVGIVSLGGRAGTGKSVLAIAAALEAVLEQRTQQRAVVFRPLFAVGGQELGYLPGSETEKMSPWGAAVTDALEAIAGPAVVEEVLARRLLDIQPLTHIRGRSLTDTFVIIDEAQNLERSVLLTALTRLGAGSKVVLTHDVAQRDNLRVGRHDGIATVVDHLRGHPLFGHVTLHRSERSAIAALVAGLLDGRQG
jgi:PhoH-like ATPase